MKSDKELADDLEAKKKLENAGYKKKPCPNDNCIKDRVKGHCFTCNNKGYIWQAPLE